MHLLDPKIYQYRYPQRKRDGKRSSYWLVKCELPDGTTHQSKHPDEADAVRERMRLRSRCRREIGTAVPPEIIMACDRPRHGRPQARSPGERPKFGGRIFVRHAKEPSLSAVVALERSRCHAPRTARYRNLTDFTV